LPTWLQGAPAAPAACHVLPSCSGCSGLVHIASAQQRRRKGGDLYCVMIQGQLHGSDVHGRALRAGSIQSWPPAPCIEPGHGATVSPGVTTDQVQRRGQSCQCTSRIHGASSGDSARTCCPNTLPATSGACFCCCIRPGPHRRVVPGSSRPCAALDPRVSPASSRPAAPSPPASSCPASAASLPSRPVLSASERRAAAARGAVRGPRARVQSQGRYRRSTSRPAPPPPLPCTPHVLPPS
jgi:hypothetical protein